MTEPVSLALAKSNLRLEAGFTDDDDLITSLIAAAREYVEVWTGLALVPATATEAFDVFDTQMILRAWPIAADAEMTITYLDTDGAQQTLADYRLSTLSRPARLAPALGSAWPKTYAAPGNVSVTFPAGYASPDLAPARTVQAILLLVNHYYANREAVIAGATAAAIELPLGVAALLDRLRVRTL